MASRELNEEKRTQMSAIIKRLISQGWTVAQLAAYAGQAVTTVRAWKDGRSTGTNYQRVLLGGLRISTDTGARVGAVRSRIEVHKAFLREYTEKAKLYPDHISYQASTARQIDRTQSWIKTLEAVLP